MRLVAADRRIVIEDILNIQVYSKMAKITKSKYGINEYALSEINRNINVVSEKIALQKQNIDINTKRNHDKINTNSSEINNYTNRLEILERETQSLLDENNILLADTRLKTKTALKTKYTKFLQIETKLDHNINQLKGQIKFFNENHICPSCNQIIGEEFKSTNISKYECKHVELVEGREKLTIELEKLTKTIEEIDQNNNKVSSNCNEIFNKETQINQIRKWIEKLEKENESIQNVVFDEENSNIVLKKLEDELKGYIKTKDGLLEEKKYLDVANQFLKDNGIKTNVIKQYLPIINNNINKYLSHMEFFTQFSLDENFEETIMSRHRDIFSYENFSEGEKLRIDLALLFAWRSVSKSKNSIDTNILIMDEIIDRSIDYDGIEHFFKLIHTCKDTNVFIISPKGDTMIDKFSSTIRFTKKQNFSECEYV